jgi:hypothetical protein
MPKMSVYPRVTASSGWHATLPGEHDLRNRDAIFPQVTSMKTDPGSDPVVSLLSDNQTLIQC